MRGAETKLPMFPPGLNTRPATDSDLEDVIGLFRLAERIDRGEAETTREDTESGWQMTDFDMRRQTLMVWSGADLVAYAEFYNWRAEATVHPDHRGRGIGSALLRWTEAATLLRQPLDEEARTGQTIVDANKGAAAMFKRAGYSPRHFSWALRLPTDADMTERTVPAGYSIRRFIPNTESHAVYRVIEDAFNEWPNRTPTTYANWRAMITDRGDFDPSLLYVALHGDEIVGVAVGLPYPEEGWVQQLAVQRDHRRRGLAKALLGATFGEMRRRGFPELGLSTDSRTGALDLYLDLGMEVRQSFTHWSKLLRPAKTG